MATGGRQAGVAGCYGSWLAGPPLMMMRGDGGAHTPSRLSQTLPVSRRRSTCSKLCTSEPHSQA